MNPEACRGLDSVSRQIEGEFAQQVPWYEVVPVFWQCTQYPVHRCYGLPGAWYVCTEYSVPSTEEEYLMAELIIRF